MESNFPYLEWFIEKINKTDGSMTSVDHTIDSNLISRLKIEREAKLNSHSFISIRPFLIGKDYSSPTLIPNTVPEKTPTNYEDSLIVSYSLLITMEFIRVSSNPIRHNLRI
uniref:Uncharacterized protein n=1 Tax=Termitomyces sp. TaxID=1916073 RepID=A0A386TYX8_9AGAR|nr:hypothetical protein C0990_000034 [Termitomyces sp.]